MSYATNKNTKAKKLEITNFYINIYILHSLILPNSSIISYTKQKLILLSVSLMLDLI